MVYIGTQYYRAPFPEEKYWEEDLKNMADSGLNAVQLWILWSWVESKPGRFDFSDYDRLVECAARNNLGVVLSTIAAIQPYWIHREVPGSEMIDNFGRTVVSSNRGECHFGLTPGGCFDHPDVLERMTAFIRAAAERYRGNDAVIGWDAWNELRWNVQSDGLVCYCPHTLTRYRSWLDKKYRGLDGLNAAWKRRYGSWDEVIPGKMPDRPYTDMMAFQEFLSMRSNEHAWHRYKTIKNVDPSKEVTVHGGQPTVLYGTQSYPTDTSLNRGNDWFFAEKTDGIGCSSFPLWGGIEMSRRDVFNRFEYLRSAAGDKKMWLSELQGGRYNIGFHVGQSVDPVRQQQWIWNGYAIGADKVLFWCWRDEVFGRESNGFGFYGNDGAREARIPAMRKTGRVIREYGDVLEAYRADRAETGILFSPQSHYLYWSQEKSGRRVTQSLQGYADALVTMGYDYEIVEEEHLDALENIKVLFMPRIGCLAESTAESLIEWVRGGGVLVCETETGAFTPEGFYRYPEERPFVKDTGIRELGRRILESEMICVHTPRGDYRLAVNDWITPMTDAAEENTSVYHEAALGAGRIIFLGSFAGEVHHNAPRPESRFAAWIGAELSAAGIVPQAAALPATGNTDDFVYMKRGLSRGKTMLFFFTPEADREYDIHLGRPVPDGAYTSLLTGEKSELYGTRVTLPPSEWGVTVLLQE